MHLNLAHLLFLHGIVKNFHQQDIDFAMKDFLHDLIIMFEIYIDTVQLDEKLMEKFNYQPLTTQENETT